MAWQSSVEVVAIWGDTSPATDALDARARATAIALIVYVAVVTVIVPIR